MLKTIIIGAGGISRQHCKALKKLGVDIAGIYDVNYERAANLAAEYGSKAIRNLPEELGMADMIHVLTPPSERISYVKMAADRGIHILMEKPVAITLDDATFMENYVKEKNVLGMMAFTQRFRKGYQKIKELMDEGKIGEIVQAFCFRVGPGPGFTGNLQESWRTNKKFVCGMSIESLSHDIDFLQSLVGEIVSVSGKVNGTIKALPEFDNNVNAVLGFDNGAIGSITASWSSHISYNIKGIIGTKGSVFLQGNDIWDSTKMIKKLEGEEQIEEELLDVFQKGDGYYQENRCFLNCIQNNRKVPCDFSAGRKALEVSKKILETSALHHIGKECIS